MAHFDQCLPQVDHGDRSRQFRSCRGGGCAQVGCKINQGEISFMAHPADDRGLRPADRPHHPFIVESPQVFHGAAPTTHKDHVRGSHPVQHLDCTDQRRGGFIPLHRRGCQDHFRQWHSPLQGLEHVPQGRAGGRSHDPDAVRKFRDGTLPGQVKKSLGLQQSL